MAFAVGRAAFGRLGRGGRRAALGRRRCGRGDRWLLRRRRFDRGGRPRRRLGRLGDGARGVGRLGDRARRVSRGARFGRGPWRFGRGGAPRRQPRPGLLRQRWRGHVLRRGHDRVAGRSCSYVGPRAVACRVLVVGGCDRQRGLVGRVGPLSRGCFRVGCVERLRRGIQLRASRQFVVRRLRGQVARRWRGAPAVSGDPQWPPVPGGPSAAVVSHCCSRTRRSGRASRRRTGPASAGSAASWRSGACRPPTGLR